MHLDNSLVVHLTGRSFFLLLVTIATQFAFHQHAVASLCGSVASDPGERFIPPEEKPTGLRPKIIVMSEAMRGDDRAESVYYFSPGAEREALRVYAIDGKLRDWTGSLLNVENAMYVFDPDGRMYSIGPNVLIPEGYHLSHSSPLAGGDVMGAGIWSVREGVISRLTNGSGHYQPDKSFLLQTRDRLRELGIEISDEHLFLYHSKRPLSMVGIDKSQFKTSTDFQINIHSYDHTDWPLASAYAFEQGDSKLKKVALDILARPESSEVSERVTQIIRQGLEDRDPDVVDAAVKAASWRARKFGDFFDPSELLALLKDPKVKKRPEILENVTREIISSLQVPSPTQTQLTAANWFYKEKQKLTDDSIGSLYMAVRNIRDHGPTESRAESESLLARVLAELKNRARDDLPWKRGTRANEYLFKFIRDPEWVALVQRMQLEERLAQSNTRRSQGLEVDLEALREANPPSGHYNLKEIDQGYQLENRDRYFRRLSVEELNRREIFAFNGLLYNDRGNILGEGAPVTLIYVMGEQGRIFADRGSHNSFHHSNFFAGSPVAAAGSITVLNGRIVEINRRSGHYLPSAFFLSQIISRLHLLGVEVPNSGDY